MTRNPERLGNADVRENRRIRNRFDQAQTEGRGWNPKNNFVQMRSEIWLLDVTSARSIAAPHDRKQVVHTAVGLEPDLPDRPAGADEAETCEYVDLRARRDRGRGLRVHRGARSADGRGCVTTGTT